jgi:hypothetical protein
MVADEVNLSAARAFFHKKKLKRNGKLLDLGGELDWASRPSDHRM